MARDPFSGVVDMPLFIVPRVLERLRTYRARPQPVAEIDALAERLLAGIEAHPTKFWVMKQFRQTLDALGSADAGVRAELDTLMDILGIRSSDGVLGADFR